jgi:hypothetical protein
MKEGLRTSVFKTPLEGQRESRRIERVFKDWREKKEEENEQEQSEAFRIFNYDYYCR